MQKINKDLHFIDITGRRPILSTYQNVQKYASELREQQSLEKKKQQERQRQNQTENKQHLHTSNAFKPKELRWTLSIIDTQHLTARSVHVTASPFSPRELAILSDDGAVRLWMVCWNCCFCFVFCCFVLIDHVDQQLGATATKPRTLLISRSQYAPHGVVLLLFCFQFVLHAESPESVWTRCEFGLAAFVCVYNLSLCRSDRMLALSLLLARILFISSSFDFLMLPSRLSNSDKSGNNNNNNDNRNTNGKQQKKRQRKRRTRDPRKTKASERAKRE